MSDPVQFYFDFSSPYAYFAALRIDEVVGRFGREVQWKPTLLGVIMKTTGNTPLATQPVKSDYCTRDWERLARFMDAPYTLPNPFPIGTQAAARAFYWLDDRDATGARLFAKTAFATYFGEGRDISTPETVADIAGGLGVDRDELLTALAGDEIKQRLKDEVAAAMQAGVCGSPYFIVDGEPFWGSDRLWMIKRWLKSGGW
jgi:2-hydroxychromene-2-carboxylate isomerase